MAMLLSAVSVLSCFLHAGVELALVCVLGWTESMTIKGSPVIRTLGLGVLSAMGLVMCFNWEGCSAFIPVSGWWEIAVMKCQPPGWHLVESLHTQCRSKEVSCAVFPPPQTDLVGGIQRSTLAMLV